MGREARAQKAHAGCARIDMTSLLPILPVLMLALFCAIAGFLSLRAIDRSLADATDSKHASQTSTDSNIRLSH